jgi:hypothetical protein
VSDAATFRAHLDTTFIAECGERAVALLLTDVDERVTTGMEQFSLLFHGPADQMLPQGTYPLAHDALGALALFLVPIGANSERVVYEACFSRLVNSP